MSNLVSNSWAVPSCTSALDVYLEKISKIPLLSQSEENRLFQDGSEGAMRLLIIHHLRFVVHVARQYRGYGLAQQDLIQEGNIGLLKAARKFSTEYGVRFVSFATYWIKSEINEYILRNWKIVKIATTKAQRKLFFNLRSMKAGLKLSGAEAKKIATDLDVKESDVQLMDMRMTGTDIAFDISNDESDTEFSPSQYLVCSNSPEADLLCDTEEGKMRKVHDALSRLDSRLQHIVTRRFLDNQKAPLRELAEELGISCERVRQLEQRAVGKLKELLSDDYLNIRA